MLIIVICYGVVRAVLESQTVDERKPFNGLDVNDSDKNIKIITYIFSVYIGATDGAITPNNTAAYMAKNLIMFCRFLFIMHVFKDAVGALKIQFQPNVDTKLQTNEILELLKSNMGTSKNAEPVFGTDG